MIEIKEKEKCSGCSACAQICPKNCIKMEADNEGFVYPSVNKSECINCNLCERVCPVINTAFHEKQGFPEGFLVYAKDNTEREKSAAGGGFAALARMFINKYNGVVFGAAYNEKYEVNHISVENVKDIVKLQKSKYVQSNIGETFKTARKYLKEGRFVLFSGTPCQIYGLKSFLGDLAGDLDSKLFCIDLSCHGVPSPKVFSYYLEALEKQENSKIADFKMRDKSFKDGFYKQGFGIEFENGIKRFKSHSQDMFGRCFWGEMVSRPSCYDCHFKTVWRTADITLGDCWFFSCFVPKEKDSMGVTMALAHTDKGLKLLSETEGLVGYGVSAEKLIKANGGMIYSSAKANPGREEFFSKLDEIPFKELVDFYLPVKSGGKSNKALSIIEKSGLRLEFLRRISRRKKLNKRLSKNIPQHSLGEMK